MPCQLIPRQATILSRDQDHPTFPLQKQPLSNAHSTCKTPTAKLCPCAHTNHQSLRNTKAEADRRRPTYLTSAGRLASLPQTTVIQTLSLPPAFEAILAARRSGFFRYCPIYPTRVERLLSKQSLG